MGLREYKGHYKGSEVLREVTEYAARLGIKVLTVFAFSTENWSRPENEVSTLLSLFAYSLNKQVGPMKEKGVRLEVIGDIEKFPLSLQLSLKNAIEETKEGNSITLVLALNYGGRDEILRATKKMILAEGCDILVDNISEERFSSFLDTARWPDVDLIIRTSGEKRLSNFLLWQSAYAELVFLDVLWPDFTKEHFLQALLEYQSRNRRMGGR